MKEVRLQSSVGPSPLSSVNCCSFSVTPPSLSAMSSLRAGTGGGGNSSSSSSSTISSCRRAFPLDSLLAIWVRLLSRQVQQGPHLTPRPLITSHGRAEGVHIPRQLITSCSKHQAEEGSGKEMVEESGESPETEEKT